MPRVSLGMKMASPTFMERYEDMRLGRVTQRLNRHLTGSKQSGPSISIGVTAVENTTPPKKNPESFKKQNLNLPHTEHYTESV